MPKKSAVPRPPYRVGIEPYPNMVAAALRSIRRRDGDQAFQHVARLTLRNVAALLDDDDRRVLRDDLKSTLRY
jgi:hypothetical protein